MTLPVLGPLCAAALVVAAEGVAGAAAGTLPLGTADRWRVIAAVGTWALLALFAAPLLAAARSAGRGRPRVAALCAAVAAAPLAWRAGATLLEGPAVSRVLRDLGGDALRDAARVATGLCVALAFAAWGASVARPAPPTRRAARGLALLAAAVVAHVRVLPGLYPAFHDLLLGVALCGAGEAGCAAVSGVPRGPTFRAAAAAALVVGFPGAWLFAFDAPTRAAAARALPLFGGVVERAAAAIGAGGGLDAVEPAPRIAPWSDDLRAEARRRLRADGLPERPSFLFVTIDALRADRVGAAGGTPGYTPRLDALAAAGWTCERAYAPAAITFHTVAATMRGLAPDRVAALPDPDAVPRLAERFAARGYRTFASFPAEAVFFGKEIGRDFSRGDLGFAEADAETQPDQRRVENFFAFLARAPREPFFAWLHLMGPHAPYTPEGGPKFGAKPSELYLAEVAEADARLGALVDRLATEGVLGTTAVCVSADHGESFGERGTFFHGLNVYDEEVRVPLVLFGPGMRPARIRSATSLLDVAPTLLDLAGLDVDADFDGRSLAPVALGLSDGADRAALVVHRHPVAGAAWKAAVRPPWKAILNERTGGVAVYDLASDPGETQPLPPADAPAAADLVRLLATPPLPVADARGGASARRAQVLEAAKFARVDDPRWARFLADPSSVVRTAAVDALSLLPSADDLLRRFAVAPGPATESERLRTLSLVNRRPRWTDLDDADDRVRYSAAYAAAHGTVPPPADDLRRRLGVETNPTVLIELLIAVDNFQHYGDQRLFERLAAREDVVGARAAALLALRRLGAAGLKRPGENIVDRNDVVVRPVDETGAEVEVPPLPAADLARGAPLYWVVFAVPGRDGKEIEAFVRRDGRPWPFKSYAIEMGALLAVRPTTEPLRVAVVGAKTRPEFLCALIVAPPSSSAAK